MKYFKFKVLGLVLGISLIISSCSDWLEMEPINQSYGEGFWTSEAAAQQTVAGGYALLRTALTSSNGLDFLFWGEMNGTTYRRKAPVNEEKFNDGSFWNPNMTQFMWDKFYKVVAQTNLMLEEIPKLDAELFADGEAGKNSYIGEALFLRAFTYFYMTRVWGGVPLVTEATTTVSQVISEDGYIKLVPRNLEVEVLNQIVADLKEAEGLLEYDAPGSDKWAIQANKGSVQALLAHVYLWMHNAAEAEKAADAAIKNGNFELVDYADSLAVLKLWEGQSPEGIFEINMDFDQTESSTNSLLHNTVYQPWLYGKVEVNGTWIVQKNYMAPLYEPADLRIIRYFGYWNTARPILLKYAGVTYEDEATHFNAHQTSNLLIMRLSDIMLLRAEALANLGRDPEALALMNEVRERAHATPLSGLTGDNLQYEIFLERTRELIGEGQLWYDRIRQQEWTGISWMTGSRIADEGYYWPVALQFIINNPMITQNPFWAKKNW